MSTVAASQSSFCAEADVASALMARLSLQRRSFHEAGIPDLSVRLNRIERCVDFVLEQQDAIVEATIADWKHKPAAFIKAVEIIPILNHAKHIKKHLKGWMKDHKVTPDFPFNLVGAKTYIRHQPLGVVGVMVPWNGPLAMAMVAAMDAFSAGNRVMVKVSEFSPATAALMAETLPKYFDESELAVVLGEVEVSKAFAELPFDHLMYTGSAGTAKHIMAAAARNLTPVTLELGGKSPVFVAADADLAYTAKRCISGRLINAGQACIGPDYVLLPGDNIAAFVGHAKACINAFFPSDRGAEDYASIATDGHFQRMHRLLADARERGAEVITIDIGADESLRQFNPCLVINPPADSLLMREEVFGPILIIKGYQNMQEAIDYVNAGERPLALYYFGKDKQGQQQVINQTLSGGVAVNEVMMHLSQSRLPFGGVGHSGMGSYWGGDAGFKRFSHARSIFEQGWYRDIAGMMDPPFGSTIAKVLKMQLKK
ncbi:aldehyde dehydrogenase family protein [Spongiibacter taiwanensis]|uniref:aldehyde dehydrogenase family protein n=1 Tax=Spongiibacter taiwanensis TaxID=1748242 RepID=UPI002034FD3A|nr:aldehyde dehydrogenase family protein [Spongiibacter taiwanensis]USA44046.1 aldehyde dehydrogenase family protein [Spongiibacter taiwanensis]